MKNFFRVGTAVTILYYGAVLGAQTQAPQPQSQPPRSEPTQRSEPTTQQPRPTQPRAAASQQSTTLMGCVYREQDVPGRSPNVAEKAGVLEDYILADVTSNQAQGTATTSSPGAAATSGSSAASSGSKGAGSMYKLELVADEKLRAMVGKRVEVMGRIDAEAGDKPATSATPQTSTTDRAIGRDRVDLPEFEVASIREVTGTCSAKPSVR